MRSQLDLIQSSMTALSLSLPPLSNRSHFGSMGCPLGDACFLCSWRGCVQCAGSDWACDHCLAFFELCDPAELEEDPLAGDGEEDGADEEEGVTKANRNLNQSRRLQRGSAQGSGGVKKDQELKGSRGAQQKPKRGAILLQLRGPRKRKGNKNYTPPEQKEEEPRAGRETLAATLAYLVALSPKELLAKLRSMGHLANLPKEKKCPFCGAPIVKHSKRMGVAVLGNAAAGFRCNAKACNKILSPLSGSPVFTAGKGADTPVLRTQTWTLHNAAWDVLPQVTRAHTGLTVNHVLKTYGKWRRLLAKWVLRKQERMKLGGDYQQIEADEAVLRNDTSQEKKTKKVLWREAIGLKTRGQRSSLVLVERVAESKRQKLEKKFKKATKKCPKGRACPPLLQSEEWAAVAKKHVVDKTILHTDGAAAYNRTPKKSIEHTKVNHSTRKGGPYYTKKTTVTVNGKPKKVIGGTQSLDGGTWTYLKKALRGQKACNAEALGKRLRQVQWHMWTARTDRFEAMGQVLRECREWGLA